MNNKKIMDSNEITPCDPVEELENALFLIVHAIDTYVQTELRKKNIAPQIGLILGAIVKLNNPTPLILARNVGRKPQTVSAILRRMESQGLISKQINENKRNTYTICLTSKGLRTYDKMIKINPFRRVAQVLSEEQCVQLTNILEPVTRRTSNLNK